MSASSHSTKKSDNKQQEDSGYLTLVELLNEEQPYRKFHRLLDPELKITDNATIKKIQGSLVGLAIGDALGASVEFRPNAYLKQNLVKEMQNGGTWGLEAGQWTDDTSMSLCLAASLIVKGQFDSYDQFERYRQWYRNGYMSSTGKCFDIGKSTRQAITKFENLQREAIEILAKQNKIPKENITDEMIKTYFRNLNVDIKCGTEDSAGNGSLMRLAPIPLFFFGSNKDVEKNIDEATRLTHGDQRAIDACRFYAGLIWHALDGKPKHELLHENFYQEYLHMSELHNDVLTVVRGSYKQKKGYKEGIRGKGYIVDALEAALWAFYNDNDSFEKGVLDAVNLGDDTDTTAAIYGELAGAVYGIEKIPERWIKQLFQASFIMNVAKGLYVKGKKWNDRNKSIRTNEDDRESHQTNTNNTTRNDRKTSGPHTTRPNQHANANSTSHHGQSASAAGTPHQTQYEGKDDASQHTTRPELIFEHGK